LLAVFNLFPGYPLDGGRVLRAYLWKRGYELNAATVLTGRAGQIISLALIVFGIFVAFFRGDFLTGLWTTLVGLFLFDSAAGIIKQIASMERLLAENVMEPPIFVAPETHLQNFVDNTLPLYHQTVFLVAKEGHLYGFLVLSDLKKLPREAWSKTVAQEIMRPVTEKLFVESDTPLIEARELLRTNELGVLGVIDREGHLVGFIRRNHLRRRSQ
jgi:CBS domain-containing protein